MSIPMDSQDVRGYLRGLCLVVVVRAVRRAPTKADVEDVLVTMFGEDLASIVAGLSSFTGIEEASLTSAIGELFRADEDFLRPENVNLQLGLLAGRPVPTFPFVECGSADPTSLYRPFLDSAYNLVHAAVRTRMQLTALPSMSDTFWKELAGFLRRVGGGDEIASAIALSTIVNVVSDVLFFNSDASTRAKDPEVAATIARVLEELRAVPGAMLIG